MLVWLGWNRVRVKIGWVALFQRVSHLGDGPVMAIHHECWLGHVVRSCAGGQRIYPRTEGNTDTGLYASQRGRRWGDGAGPARSIIGTRVLCGSHNGAPSPKTKREAAMSKSAGPRPGPGGRVPTDPYTIPQKQVYVNRWDYTWLKIVIREFVRNVPESSAG